MMLGMQALVFGRGNYKPGYMLPCSKNIHWQELVNSFHHAQGGRR